MVRLTGAEKTMLLWLSAEITKYPEVYQGPPPQTNGKAERVIRTLMEEWHANLKNGDFITREERRKIIAGICSLLQL